MSKDFQKLQEDIIGAIGLSRQEATGFHAMVCPICRNERKTGGFKFEQDKIIYNCFRASCGSSTVYEIDTPVSKKFKALMTAIGVKIPMTLNAKKNVLADAIRRTLDLELYEKVSYQEIECPEDWKPLQMAEGKYAEFWKQTISNRQVELNDIFFIKSGVYKNLVAGGIYYYDKLIGFQIITRNTNGPKYIVETINDGLVYLPERTIPNIPILVEGYLDAKCFPNTVATLHSKLSKKQAYILKDCREWWLLPDRNTENFLEIMRDYPNCKMIIPNWRYKDLNEAVMELGVIEVAEIIKNSLVDNYQEAKVKLRLWTTGG